MVAGVFYIALVGSGEPLVGPRVGRLTRPAWIGPSTIVRQAAALTPGMARQSSCIRRRPESSSSSSSSSRPSRRAAATILRTWVRLPQPSSISRLRSAANGLAELGADPLADLLAGRVEDGQLLLGEVVVDRGGQLLDGVVEGLGVGALELEHRQQRLVALGVLLLAVLGLVLADRALAAQLGVDELLLRQGVGDVERGEGARGPRRGRCWLSRSSRSSASKRRWSSRIRSTTSPWDGRPRSMAVMARA